MIIEGLVGIFMTFYAGVMSIVYGLYPGVPDWLSSGLLTLMQVLGWLHHLDHWVPVDLAMMVAGAVMAAWSIAIVIQTIRTITSYIFLGGGAT